jgi:hypothetical protein
MEDCGCEEKCPNCECQQKKLLDETPTRFEIVRKIGRNSVVTSRFNIQKTTEKEEE